MNGSNPSSHHTNALKLGYKKLLIIATKPTKKNENRIEVERYIGIADLDLYDKQYQTVVVFEP